MAKKGVAPKITRMNKAEYKTRPIPRDRDNTDDLYDEETRARARYNKFQHPDKGTPGTFDPAKPQGGSPTAPRIANG